MWGGTDSLDEHRVTQRSRNWDKACIGSEVVGALWPAGTHKEFKVIISSRKKKRCIWNSDENVQLRELSVNSKLTDQTGKSTISYRESFRVSDVEASREHQVKGWVVKALGEALPHHIKQLVCKGQEIPRKRGLQDLQRVPQEWINQAKSVYSGGRMLHFCRWFWDHTRAQADGECPGTFNYKPWM